MMMDENGNDYQHDYPEKEKYTLGCKFVSEVSGNEELIDLDDLNLRIKNSIK